MIARTFRSSSPHRKVVHLPLVLDDNQQIVVTFVARSRSSTQSPRAREPNRMSMSMGIAISDL